MKNRKIEIIYIVITGIVFLMVGVLHFFRIINNWEITVNGTSIPFLLSYIGLPEAIVAFIVSIWIIKNKGK